MNRIEKAIDYVGHFDADWPKRLRGASEESIAELMDLVGGKLPGVYVDFLRHMGENAGGCRIGNADVDLQTVLSRHRQSRGSFPGFLLIGAGPEDPYFDLFLEENAASPEEPRVIACAWSSNFRQSLADFRSPVAGRLEEAICRPAFYRFVLNAMPFQESRLVSASAAATPAAGRKLISTPLQELWFSNTWSWVAESREAAVHFWKAGNTLSVRLGCRSERLLKGLTAELLSKIPGLHRV